MANTSDQGGLSGRDLQQSQMTGSGEGGVTRDRMQSDTGGSQLGGGPEQSDMANPGGSSGSGGYGRDQQSERDLGGQSAPAGHDEKQSRGERFDEEQGGGRGPESISADSVAQVGGSDGSFDQHTDDNQLSRAADELLRDQQAHQDRGQGDADFESDAPA